MPKWLAVLVFLTSFPLLAQSRFDGTWRMKMDTLEFSATPEEYLVADGVYHCLSCAPKVDIKADGADHKAEGHEAFYDTIAVRVLDAQSLDFTFKKNGKLVAMSKETVSSDGKTMIEEFQNAPKTDSITGKAGFIRVAEGPPGSHALSGKWQMRTIKNDTDAGTLTTYRSIPNGLRITSGRETYEAKFDGKDYPVGKDLHSTVSLTLIDEDTFEETDKHNGKVLTVSRITVSKDGTTMKVESTDQQRGATMTSTQNHPDIGSVTVNTAPPSGAFAASMLPLCSFITDLQMLSPNPVPRPGRFVV